MRSTASEQQTFHQLGLVIRLLDIVERFMVDVIPQYFEMINFVSNSLLQ